MKCKRLEFSWILVHLYNIKSPLYSKFRAIEEEAIQDRALHGETIINYPMSAKDEKTFLELLNKIRNYYERNDSERKGKRNIKHKNRIR